MDIKTFRAKTMQEALGLVRRELGPDASVLHTRELNGGLVRRMLFGRKYEVAASSNVNVPSRCRRGCKEQGAGSRERESGTCTCTRSALHAPGSELRARPPGRRAARSLAGDDRQTLQSAGARAAARLARNAVPRVHRHDRSGGRRSDRPRSDRPNSQRQRHCTWPTRCW